ncbi:3-isopropylmalate dehydratase large subunit [Paraburkholderia aromaticivorans]|uniref:3-isopropylmalate dehydratase large subunit n=1 Tax=Paraburkholderia aromaticivorans TaxID=2026199 RepID=UPI00145609C5|nr:3-isopropylmalate dehydratase large subunit [Paraburkholderia aromaticivorans]
MSTLFGKLWDAHRVAGREDGTDLLYIDRHVLHEVTSPQAFSQLRKAGREVRMPMRHIAVPDHSLPTALDPAALPRTESIASIAALERNTAAAGIPLFAAASPQHGIVHVIAAEQGFVVPGCSVVCGDSHTATLGALGALAFGIGTSEVEHVLATQSLWMRRPATLGIEILGELPPGVYAKDLALTIIKHIGTRGAAGHAIEYFGPAISALSVEARMTVCNMSIEAGGRFAVMAPDAKTIAYVKARLSKLSADEFAQAEQAWRFLKTDARQDYDRVAALDASDMTPMVTWGTTPADSTTFDGRVGDPDDNADRTERERVQTALEYMGLKARQRINDVPIDMAFIGSCTNGRLEDLQAAASILKGRRIHSSVRALAVPGSAAVKAEAEREGLAQIFVDAGFEWRTPGCSMCIGMNGDQLAPGQRCASSSNRNFENRQGPGGRSHLVSPAAAAAAAITGRLTDPREFLHG